MPRHVNPKRNSRLSRRQCDYRSRTRLNPKYLLVDIQAEGYLRRFHPSRESKDRSETVTDSTEQVSKRSSLKTAIK